MHYWENRKQKRGGTEVGTATLCALGQAMGRLSRILYVEVVVNPRRT